MTGRSVSPVVVSVSKPIARLLIPAAILLGGCAAMLAGVRPAIALSRLDQFGFLGPPVFVFLAAAMMSFLVPKTAISLAAGAVFGMPTGCVTLSAAAVLAASLNYAIGRFWLSDWVRRRQGVGWKALQSLAGGAGFGTHLLFRLAPVPTSVISYTSGAAGARLMPFLSAAAVGSIPQWIWVHCGAVAGDVARSNAGPEKWTSFIISLLAAAAVSVILPRLAAREIRQHRLAVPST